MSDYAKYRGKCKEMCQALIEKDTTLRLVRGHYFCPVWNTDEQHWWCVKPDGSIVDPTAKQFGSKGHGIYTEFDGYVNCEQCGKRIAEEDIFPMGRFPTCSTRCAMNLVGI